MIGAVFGPPAEGETGQGRELLPLLDETMLLPIDRGFDGGNFLAAATAAGAPSWQACTATARQLLGVASSTVSTVGPVSAVRLLIAEWLLSDLSAMVIVGSTGWSG